MNLLLFKLEGRLLLFPNLILEPRKVLFCVGFAWFNGTFSYPYSLALERIIKFPEGTSGSTFFVHEPSSACCSVSGMFISPQLFSAGFGGVASELV